MLMLASNLWISAFSYPQHTCFDKSILSAIQLSSALGQFQIKSHDMSLLMHKYQLSQTLLGDAYISSIALHVYLSTWTVITPLTIPSSYACALHICNALSLSNAPNPHITLVPSIPMFKYKLEDFIVFEVQVSLVSLFLLVSSNSFWNTYKADKLSQTLCHAYFTPLCVTDLSVIIFYIFCHLGMCILYLVSLFILYSWLEFTSVLSSFCLTEER